MSLTALLQILYMSPFPVGHHIIFFYNIVKTWKSWRQTKEIISLCEISLVSPQSQALTTLFSSASSTVFFWFSENCDGH